MDKMMIPYFGEINFSSIEECYETEIELNGKEVELDLCFENNAPDKEWFEHYKNYAKSLDMIKKNICGKIVQYSDEGLIKEFVSYHIEEQFDAEELNEILHNIDDSLPDSERMLLALEVGRIAFYPEEDNFSVWDFTFKAGLSDEILAVVTDESGEIVEFLWEN